MFNAAAQEHSFTNQTEAGILAGSAGTSPVFTFQTFNGIRMEQWNAEAGITVGADLYNQVKILPIALGIRYRFLTARKISPYLSFDGGYGFDWLERETETDYSGGGIMLNPAVGIKIRSLKATAFHCNIGFKSQTSARYRTTLTHVNRVKEEYKYGRLSFRVGITY